MNIAQNSAAWPCRSPRRASAGNYISLQRSNRTCWRNRTCYPTFGGACRPAMALSRTVLPRCHGASRSSVAIVAVRKPPRQKRETPRIVVLSIRRREGACGECGNELFPGDLIHLDDRRVARCMDCADLGHLIYLPAGDATLTRRATAHSKLAAVVVRWSVTRKRYERQGTLVEEEALGRAEGDCLSDAEQREAARIRAAERRELLDAEFVGAFARAIRDRYPDCPEGADLTIAEHACEKHSGRVGRSADAKALFPGAIDLAVRAHVRHRWTRYDENLMRGWGRDDARVAVRDEVEAILLRWREAASKRAGLPIGAGKGPWAEPAGGEDA